MESESIASKHISVLLHELVESITIFPDKQNIIVDATLGMAGHACEVIQKLNSGDIFIGFDADTRNLPLAAKRIASLHNISLNICEPGQDFNIDIKSINVLLIHSNFEHLKTELASYNIGSITGIYYDLGISSLHVDEADRGFSFREDGPLDMRFDITTGQTAADIVNSYDQAELRQMFVDYGEEPGSTKIAARIIEQRKQEKIRTTGRLVDVIESVNTHPKTKTRIFQAIRIEVNGELEVMKQSFRDAISLLQKDGNIFVISFHSLEDRITKQMFKRETRDCICSDIICSCHHVKSLKVLTKKPILPTQDEIQQNSRSRSAKARHARKII
ncbi:16S rRNA (cytosine(1402)-N(4))-methyltransferase RsmH [Candidatus Gracilibacteria bacterium]|nr:16S rRNA (cytosine(1402)-N(4))-methyltransferase RsmH [Candidatus Gracilibacteria bacterium]